MGQKCRRTDAAFEKAGGRGRRSTGGRLGVADRDPVALTHSASARATSLAQPTRLPKEIANPRSSSPQPNAQAAERPPTSMMPRRRSPIAYPERAVSYCVRGAARPCPREENLRTLTWRFSDALKKRLPESVLRTRKAAAGLPAAAPSGLVLAWHVERPVAAVEARPDVDLRQREVGERDTLRDEGLFVRVGHRRQHGAVVRMVDPQLPEVH